MPRRDQEHFGNEGAGDNLTDRVWTMEEIIGLMDEAAPKPGRPKTYKKRAAA